MKVKSNSGKPLGSVSLDLDNKWSYMKTHGDAGWVTFPSYLDVFVPRVIDVLRTLDLRVTVFVVGQDAALDANRDALRSLVAAGHEVGNHSFSHEQWFHLDSSDRVRREISEAHQAIARATDCEPIGYRGPGFTWTHELLHVLADQGYSYDASTLPTYIGPLARMYYLRTSEISAEEREQRAKLFGSFRDGMRPVKPYFWDLGAERRVLEIPVTTIPILKTPFHLSYLLYLSRFSTLLMTLYLRLAITLCRMTRTEPSFLLHPLDLMDSDQAPELAFFPGMNVSAGRKVEIFQRVLRQLGRHFELVDMSTHARAVAARDAAGSAVRTVRLSDETGA